MEANAQGASRVKYRVGPFAGVLVPHQQHALASCDADPGGALDSLRHNENAFITPSSMWLLRYEFMFRGDVVIVFHKQQGFKDLEHGSAFRVIADQGIRVKIMQNWRVTFEYDFRYNTLPVSGLKTTDTNIIFWFSYDFKP